MKTLKDLDFLTREAPPVSFFAGAQSLVNALHAEGRVALMQLQEANEKIARLEEYIENNKAATEAGEQMLNCCGTDEDELTKQLGDAK
jgi:hypothetical protein